MIKDVNYGQILFHIKGNIDEQVVYLDVNGFYAFAMAQLRIPKGKPRVIEDDNITDENNTFIIKVEILDVVEKPSSRFKKDNVYIIDNITYNDFIQYQNVKIKIISSIYWNEGYIDNNEIRRNLLSIITKSENVNEIRQIKNQINFIHVLLLTKDKLKNFIKTKDELESFIEMNEPLLLGYHRKNVKMMI
jgi:hypothetical protein